MIVESGLITCADDIYKLNIIDFGRLNGYWGHQGEAMCTILSWLQNKVTYAIAKTGPLSKAPEYPGFRWKHVGNHVDFGHAYWNWFYAAHDNAVLAMSDEPDFNGHFLVDGEKRYFFGDIGEVSPSTFMLTFKQSLRAHDIWVSVLDDTEQVILEPQYTPAKCITFSQFEKTDAEIIEQG